MPRTFLEVLPTEIRDIIYRFVLCSPTGIITLSKSSYRVRPFRYRIHTCDDDPSETISLSLLRTCKQIYQECNNKLWKWNALDIEELKSLHSRDAFKLRGLDPKITSQVRKVQMDLNPTKYEPVEPEEEGMPGLALLENLQELGRWQNLEELTVTLRDKFSDKDPISFGHDNLVALLDNRRKGDTVYEEWRRAAAGNGHFPFIMPYRSLMVAFIVSFRKPPANVGAHENFGYLSHLKRKLIINTGEPAFSENFFPTRCINVEKGDPNVLLSELNHAFGGSLWLDGRLIYEKGTMLREAFTAVEHPIFPPSTPGVDIHPCFYYERDISAVNASITLEHALEISRCEALAMALKDGNYPWQYAENWKTEIFRWAGDLIATLKECPAKRSHECVPAYGQPCGFKNKFRELDTAGIEERA